MNPLNEHQQAVFDTVKKFPHIGIEMIGKISQIKNRLYLIKVLKDLCALGRLSVEIENGDPGYTIVDEANEIAAKTKTTPLGSNGENQEKGMRPTSTGRDTGKYIFEGNSYGKGRLVWAVVKAWLDANKKSSLGKMQTVFPDELQKNYGFIVEYPKAKKMSVGRERYYMREGETFQVAGKRVCVCSQWGTGKAFDQFLKIAKDLGYKIKRA